MALYELDKEHANSVMVVSPTCYNCHYLERSDERRCAAFAKIPLEIWNGKNDHTSAYPGDNGIQFEMIQIKRAA